MGSDAPQTQKASNNDEIFMQHSLQFGESLKDLKNLRKQLYSAAEYFESSYDKNDHQQLVMESSRDYITKALVSTVDHLGSVADKFSKFLDKKTIEFSATNIRFSCIQQRLGMLQGLNELRGLSLSQQWLTVEAPKHNKQYNVQECFEMGKSKLIHTTCSPSPTKSSSLMLPHLQSSLPSSPNPLHFSYTRLTSKKQTGKHLISPHGFSLKRSESVANRSNSPTFSHNKHRSPSVPRGAIILDTTNKERDISASYTKRSKHLFRALFSMKGNHKLQMMQR